MNIKLYTIAFAIFACMYLLSCKKDHKTPAKNSDGMYNLHINVANFTQTISNDVTNNLKTKTLSIVSTHDSLASLVTNLELIIYDSRKKIYLVEDQLSTSATFGTFDKKLSPGTYRFCIVGYNGQTSVIYADKYIISGTNKSPGTSIYINQWSPVYSCSKPLTILNSDVNTSATLTRVTSQVVVNITDAMPASVTEIQLTPSYDVSYFNFYDNVPQQQALGPNGVVTAQTIGALVPAFSIGKTGFKIAYNLLMDTTISVNIIATGKPNGSVIANRTVSNIRVKPNYQVTLSGNLFGGNTTNGTGNGFKISLDTAWSQTGNLTQTFSSQNKKAAQ